MYDQMINYIKENNPELMDKLTLSDLENIFVALKNTVEIMNKPLYQTDWNEWMRQPENCYSVNNKSSTLLELINNGMDSKEAIEYMRNKQRTKKWN